MIISRTPFRVSLFGGSTDYESFYSRFGSFLIGFCLNKYAYLAIRKTPKYLPHKTLLTYSTIERLNSNQDIQHSAIKGVMDYCNIQFGIELNHFSDLPSQTGTGSSSSFIVGLLNSIYALEERLLSKEEAAKIAIDIERNILAEPGGIQDQIWASHGGLNTITINPSGSFCVKSILVDRAFKKEFINRSILVYTGKTRKSFAIARSLGHQRTDKYKKKLLDISQRAYDSFISSDIDNIGILLREAWLEKKKLSTSISSEDVDKLYRDLQSDGMIGGKLIGAGKSGFIFGILKESKDKELIKKKYINNIDFAIDEEGSKIINR